MTEAEIRIRNILTQTGLYSGKDRLFCAEMAAYGVGLGILFDAIKRCQENLFVQTADEETLSILEKLFRTIPSESNVKSRREMLLERGSVTPEDHTQLSLERQLLAAGIRGNIVENHQSGLYINVHEVLGITQEAASAEAKTFLPAHLPYIIDFGTNTWDAVDARDLTFDEMDTAGYTWNIIDQK